MSSATLGIGCVEDNAGKNANVYLIFAREVGPLIKTKYPNVQKLQFNQILGRIWNELPAAEKKKYYLKAEAQKQLDLNNTSPGPRLAPSRPEPVLIQAPKVPLVRLPVGRPALRKLRPAFPKFDKDKYPTFQSYYQEIRPQLKWNYPQLDEEGLVKRGFELFKEMHRSEARPGFGFQMFSMKTKQNLIKKYPNLTLNEIGQLVEKMWENLSAGEKENWETGVTTVKIVSTGGGSPVGEESQSEKTENILMREDDSPAADTETVESNVNTSNELEEKQKEIEVQEKSEATTKSEPDNDPLFIKCESQTAEEIGNVPEVSDQEAGTNTAEEEDVDDPEDPEVEAGEVSSRPEVYCYCRTTVTDNLVGCEGCGTFYHEECLAGDKSQLGAPGWRCPECCKVVPPVPGSSVSPKNKVSPVTYPRFVKYQKVNNRMRRVVTVDRGEGKCTTCKILVEEVKRRGDIIAKLEKEIEVLRRKKVSEGSSIGL